MSKIFETIFSIGGRLQPSLGQATGGASNQLNKLAGNAKALGVNFGTLAKRLVALGAAYLGWKGISTFFGEALKSSRENADLNFRLLNTLRSMPAIQKAGANAYKEQYDKLLAISKEYGKIGVLGQSHFKTSMQTLTKWGLGPREVAKISKAVGDVAVAQHGVNASVEQMGELSEKAASFIQRGNARALGPMLGYMTSAEQKQLKTMNAAQRMALYLRLAERAYKGFNEEAGKTPEAAPALFRKEWGSFIREIGDNLIPLEHSLAQVKRDLLAAFGKPVLNAIGEFGKYFKGDTFLNPATGNYEPVTGATSQFMKDMEPLKSSFGELGDSARKLAEAFGAPKASGQDLGEWARTQLSQEISDIARFFEGWAKAVDKVTGALDALRKAYEWVGSRGGKAPTIGEGAGQDILGTKLGAEMWAETKLGHPYRMRARPRGPEAAAPWEKMPETVAKATEEINKTKKETDNVTTAASGTKNEFNLWTVPQQLFQQLRDVLQGVNAVKSAASGGLLKAPEIQMAVRPEEFQHGGIVRRPHIGIVGEAGPEAIIPLRGAERSRSLLNRAQTLVGGSGRQAAGATLNYAPTINFNGEADLGVVDRVRALLRENAEDFIKRYKEAFDEERRLAFD